MKKPIRDFFLTYVSKCYEALDRRQRLLIITLHRVNGTIGIPLETVAQCMAYLAEKYQIIVPSQIEHLSDRKKAAIITIDDCHEDLYEFIFPLALKFNIPITVSIPTDFFFRQQWLWFDKVLWALENMEEGEILQLKKRFNLYGTTVIYRGLLNEFKKFHPEQRDEMVEEIIRIAGLKLPREPIEGFRPVSILDMKAMLKTGLIEIASHSVTHPILSTLPEEKIETEVEQSKSEIEAFQGKEVISFCYPNGLNGDFNKTTRKFLQQAGYRIAFTSIEGNNYTKVMDLFELKRISMHRNIPTFHKMISGVSDLQTFFCRQR